MEQLTWPRGSGGHIFSTISVQRRHHCSEALETGSQRSKDRRPHYNQHHYRCHHTRPQIDSAEQANGYGVDQSTAKTQDFYDISTRKDGNLLVEDASGHGADQLPCKAQNSLSRQERKQELSAFVNHIETAPDINRRVFCMLSAPLVPSISEVNPRTSPPRNQSFPYTSSSLRRWPNPFWNTNPTLNISNNLNLNPGFHIVPASNSTHDFSMLPDDILLRIAGSFSWPNLWSASRVCRSWCQAFIPLREAMHFVHWGKRFKHGRGGVSQNLDKALHSFLNGAKRGCAAAMVDAGLLLWEMGQKQDGVYWYKQAAELGDPAGQCNLGLAYLQDPKNPKEAVKWFQRAASAGHVRAQYSLALCLQQGRGVDCSVVKAARWYQRAAEGGSARAMYNLALCYRKGEGLSGDSHEARKWMKRAALAGHRKAQFEHGLTLFAENDGGLALVFLELATRAGETAATHLRDALIQQLSPKMRTHAITCADKWQAKLNARA